MPLGSRPLIVLAAGKRPAPPGTPEDVWTPLRAEKDEQRADLATLSSNSRLVRDPSSGHQMQADNPQLVARAIEAALEAAARGTRLPDLAVPSPAPSPLPTSDPRPRRARWT